MSKNNLNKTFIIKPNVFTRQRKIDGKWQVFQRMKDPTISDAYLKKYGPKNPDKSPIFNLTWVVTGVFWNRQDAFDYGKGVAIETIA